MTNFELNIGLIVGTDEFSAENTWGQVSERANHIERRLRSHVTGKVRRDCGGEPTLVVRGWAEGHLDGFHQWLYQLAETYRQDCIAVYYPRTDKGHLIGPDAEAWGDFDYNQFVRY